jgi:hypothetical protein
MDINQKINRTKDAAFVRQYLLGVLPETESHRLEQRYLDDEAFFEEIQEIEDELIDDYAGGALTDQDRIRFEEYFLCSPERREKLQFALALTERAVSWKEQTQTSGLCLTDEARGPLAASSEEKHGPENVLPFRGPSRAVPAWRLWAAIAAAVLIAIVTGALWLRNSELRRDLLSANAEKALLQNEADASSERTEQATAEKKQAQEQATTFHDQIQALTNSLEKLQPTRILSAFVGLENLVRVTRGKNIGKPKTIKIPPNALALSLSVEFDATRFQNFEATLEHGEGHSVWSSSKALTSRVSGDKQSFTLRIPAQSLTTGAYQLIIKPTESEGKDEVACYLLKIVR